MEYTCDEYDEDNNYEYDEDDYYAYCVICEGEICPTCGICHYCEDC